MQQPTPHMIRLAARQTVNLDVGRGAVLRVVRGNISMIASPQWLAETLLPGEHPLRQGENWQFERHGYLTLRTDDVGAQLVYQPPQPQPARFDFGRWPLLTVFWRGNKRHA
ncbi:hypothetical protein R0381_002377 [Jeongeupia wiesaeckerbachi]|uniref:hypothetical protein n=1 Tax=Jeongeupia wiesaeckerbachi TaxID=3051218 RepID=UPI003D806CBB